MSNILSLRWLGKKVITERVFGIGMKKTGTTSLKRCFDVLDLHPIAPNSMASLQTRLVSKNLRRYNDYSMALKYAEKFKSFEDSPWNLWEMYKNLNDRFPDSLFILTIRDSEKWWRSVKRWTTVTKPWMSGSYRQHLGVSHCGKDAMIGAYERYNREVIQYFEGGNNLLVIDFEKNDGWEAMCDFLNCPIPDQAFPHVNRQTYDEKDATRKEKILARRRKKTIGNVYIQARLFLRHGHKGRPAPH